MHRRQGRKARSPCRGAGPLLQPGDHPIAIDRGGKGHVLEVCFLSTPLAGLAEAEGPHTL